MPICEATIGVESPTTEGHEARLYEVSEAIEWLKVGRTTFYGLLKSGDLKSVKVGARRLVSERALYAYIERLEASA